MGTSQKLDALTGLRFFAGSAIVIHHLRSFGLPNYVLDGWLLNNGVGFFFVLSGFILTYVYPTLDTAHAARRFWVARFARIWPAHMAALVLCYVLLDGDPASEGTGVDSLALGLANIALLQAWIPVGESFFSYNSVSWSISTEAFFYLAFPFLVANLGRTWWVKLGLVALVSLALVVASQVESLPLYTSMGQGITLTGVVYINPLARLFEFMMGMCAAHAWRSLHTKVQLPLLTGTILEGAAVLLVLGSAGPVMHLGAWVNAHFGFAGAQWLGQGGGMSLSFAAFILVMAFQKGLLSRALGSRALVFLGEISFMVYLIHYVLLRAYVLHAAWFSTWSDQARLAFFVFVLFGLSTLMWKFIEKPARRLIFTRFDQGGETLIGKLSPALSR